MDTVICKEVIITTIKRRGNGKTTPIRVITEVYEKDGTLIAEHDPCFPKGFNWLLEVKNNGGEKFKFFLDEEKRPCLNVFFEQELKSAFILSIEEFNDLVNSLFKMNYELNNQ